MHVLAGLASVTLILTVLPSQAQSLRERLRQELEEAREQVRDEVSEVIDEEDAAQPSEAAPPATSTTERAPPSGAADTARPATRRAAPAPEAAAPVASMDDRARSTRGAAPAARTLEPSSPEVMAAVRVASDKSEECAAVPEDADPQRRQAATSCTQLCGMLIDQIPRIAASNADAIPQMQFLCDGAHAQSLGLPMPQPPGRADQTRPGR